MFDIITKILNKNIITKVTIIWFTVNVRTFYVTKFVVPTNQGVPCETLVLFK